MPDTYESPWHMLSTQDPFAEWMNERRDEAPLVIFHIKKLLVPGRGACFECLFLNFF